MNLDLEFLRSKIDLEGKYVDFSFIRASLTVLSLAEDVGVKLNEPNEDGECRGDCPKCDKKKSFSLNINKNRFNCFNKTCDLKGGGVIDFASKLFETGAKEASHLLACAYGIQPYTAEFSGAGFTKLKEADSENREARQQTETNFVSRSDYEKLEKKHEHLRKEFNTLRNIVYSYMLEQDEANIESYENGEYGHTVAH